VKRKKKSPIIVDVNDTKADLGKLIEDAEHGKPFTIAVDGKPLVKVSRIEKSEMDKLPKPEDAEPKPDS
jgi:prevent-host-death family protein